MEALVANKKPDLNVLETIYVHTFHPQKLLTLVYMTAEHIKNRLDSF